MCGDGTNDVGALKQAHVGVALLNGSERDLRRIAEHQRITRFKEMYEKQVALLKRWAPNNNPPPVPVQIAHLYPPGPSNPHREKALAALAKSKDGSTIVNGVVKDTISSTSSTSSATTKATAPEKATPKALANKKKTAEELAASFSDKFMGSMMEDEDEPPTLKLGDASCAAPFTSKLANVVSIANIVRQGRCTLVAMIQMYKILALNCLISAYSLSVLYMKGIKFGDGQATISGMLMSVCFLGISRAKVWMLFAQS
jgi:manganese-transporting P-type ATPase